MDLKKEDQDYIDSEIKKQNNLKQQKVNTNVKTIETPKKADNKLLLFALIFLVISILGIFLVNSGLKLPSELYGILIYGLLIVGGISLLFLVIYLAVSVFFEFIGLFNKEQEKVDNSEKIKNVTIIIVLIFILLFIILSFIPMPRPSRVGNPTTATRQLIHSQINNPGSVVCTGYVEFSKARTPELSTEGIVKDSGLEKGQVYFTTPIEGIVGFSAENPEVLVYNSNSKKKVVMCVLCDEHSDISSPITERLGNLGLTAVDIDSSNNGQTVCIVFPRKSAQ